MKVSFVDKAWSIYPIPRSLSIWHGDGDLRQPVEDINVLLESVVTEAGSDIFITDYQSCYGMSTQMPEDTITCKSASLTDNFPFQGNRLVKVTYDASSRKAFVRFFPATITYIRKLRTQDLDDLVGAKYRYCQLLFVYRMVEKELSVLKSVNFAIDNAGYNIEVLEKFRDEKFKELSDLRDEVLIYAAVH
jgi:hypothetical protein